METYKAMKARQQKEVDEFPFGFAFSEQQFEKMMKNWGLDHNSKEDLEKISRTISGGFIQKKDIPAMKEMFQRHGMEREDAIVSDKTGEGYIYQMFLYELKNYEFGYTGDSDDVVEALDLTYEEIEANPALKNGFEMAKNKIFSEEM